MKWMVIPVVQPTPLGGRLSLVSRTAADVTLHSQKVRKFTCRLRQIQSRSDRRMSSKQRDGAEVGICERCETDLSAV